MAEDIPLISLQGYILEPSNEAITLTLYWQSLTTTPVDYRRFVHLLGPENNTPLIQNDAMPDNNSYPTSQWQPGEIITDTVILPLNDLPPNNYQLAIGWYELKEGFPRLTAIDQNNNSLPDNRLQLPDQLPLPQ